MAEQFSKNQRLLLPPEDQISFLNSVRDVLNLSWAGLSRMVNVHPRRMSDWNRGDGSIPYSIAKEFSALSGISVPKSGKIVNQYWNNHAAAVKAGNLVYKKYGRIGGDPEHRKGQWKKWWIESNKQNNLGSFAIQKEIQLPVPSVKLAELVGIILGDGGITERQVRITLDSDTDSLYVPYAAELFQSLFGVLPTVRTVAKARAVTISLSRTSLVSFLNRVGLRTGNKIRHQVDIPVWIKSNVEFSRACVRGLMDTDGCIFTERHLIRGKTYCYPRMSFVNHSIPLLESVLKILATDGFEARLRGNRSVTLEKPTDVIRYFKRVGSNNPKHLTRFRNTGERV
ncbi:hypothetical protein BH11PAT2_BH11PAT2_08970 [soil metagenome]